ncbi:chemotaxis-specific protein-glutamate methyltransferase CheB [Reyranella sp.]|uniref:chemotaxis-specific protein-glutamate methyltransferase CheB n=1 Tax=Reyranella sp. TaxID=1929291 RepID=UPI003C7BE365
MIRLLVVDDSALMRRLLGQIFAGEPEFEVEFARNGVEALERIASFDPQVVTLDINMPQMDGLACLDRIMVEAPRPVVMVSSLTAEGAEATLEALRLGAVDFVAKPEGAISLHLDALKANLVGRVRAASQARIRSSTRLRDRIRHRIGGAASAASRRPTQRPAGPEPEPIAAVGDGLVLVGTSTGGPPALEALLTALPADFPWPVVVAQHMPAAFTGALARRLDGLCAVTVKEVSRTTSLRPGHVYIGRGDADVVVARLTGGLVAMPRAADPDYPWHPSTERLVVSAMEHVAPTQLIGVLMTGMGSDGAQAMASLRSLGGRTIAESEETAVVWGMPGELVRRGGAEWTLPLPEIGPRLVRLVP